MKSKNTVITNITRTATYGVCNLSLTVDRALGAILSNPGANKTLEGIEMSITQYKKYQVSAPIVIMKRRGVVKEKERNVGQ
jgi:hypothetical protein